MSTYISADSNILSETESSLSIKYAVESSTKLSLSSTSSILVSDRYYYNDNNAQSLIKVGVEDALLVTPMTRNIIPDFNIPDELYSKIKNDFVSVCELNSAVSNIFEGREVEFLKKTEYENSIADQSTRLTTIEGWGVQNNDLNATVMSYDFSNAKILGKKLVGYETYSYDEAYALNDINLAGKYKLDIDGDGKYTSADEPAAGHDRGWIYDSNGNKLRLGEKIPKYQTEVTLQDIHSSQVTLADQVSSYSKDFTQLVDDVHAEIGSVTYSFVSNNKLATAQSVLQNAIDQNRANSEARNTTSEQRISDYIKSSCSNISSLNDNIAAIGSSVDAQLTHSNRTITNIVNQFISDSDSKINNFQTANNARLTSTCKVLTEILCSNIDSLNNDIAAAKAEAKANDSSIKASVSAKYDSLNNGLTANRTELMDTLNLHQDSLLGQLSSMDRTITDRATEYTEVKKNIQARFKVWNSDHPAWDKTKSDLQMPGEDYIGVLKRTDDQNGSGADDPNSKIFWQFFGSVYGWKRVDESSHIRINNLSNQVTFLKSRSNTLSQEMVETNRSIKGQFQTWDNTHDRWDKNGGDNQNPPPSAIGVIKQSVNKNDRHCSDASWLLNHPSPEYDKRKLWLYASLSEGWIRFDTGAGNSLQHAIGTLGQAAKLAVNDEGSITGWEYSDPSSAVIGAPSTPSMFAIHADHFYVASSKGRLKPFRINTIKDGNGDEVASSISFNGSVSFERVSGSPRHVAYARKPEMNSSKTGVGETYTKDKIYNSITNEVFVNGSTWINTSSEDKDIYIFSGGEWKFMTSSALVKTTTENNKRYIAPGTYINGSHVTTGCVQDINGKTTLDLDNGVFTVRDENNVVRVKIGNLNIS